MQCNIRVRKGNGAEKFADDIAWVNYFAGVYVTMYS